MGTLFVIVFTVSIFLSSYAIYLLFYDKTDDKIIDEMQDICIKDLKEKQSNIKDKTINDN